MKILSIITKPIVEAKVPETKEELDAANKAGAKEDLERNRDALTKAIYDGNEELADELRDVIKGLEQELKESEDKEALRARLNKLKDEYAQLPKNPGNQEGYDALDDYREEIKSLEQKLNEADVGANAEYQAKLEEAKQLLQMIDVKLRQHAGRQRRDASNWGYAGDMQDVVSKLTQIEEFLTSI